MPGYINGMGHVGPQHGVLHRQVGRAAPIPPTVVIESQAIIARAKEHIIHQPVAAAHQVDAITPPPGRKALDVAHGHITALAPENRIMLRVDDRNALHMHPAGMGDFHPPQGLEKHSTAHNPHILGLIHPEFRFHQSPRSQIDRTITGDVDLIIGQILGLMHSRTEIYQPAVLAKDVLRAAVPDNHVVPVFSGIGLLLHLVGKQMKVSQTVAAELHTQFGRPVQTEDQGMFPRLAIRDATGQRTDFHVIHRFSHSHDLHVHRLVRIKLRHGSLAAGVHVHIHSEHLQLPPFLAALCPPDIHLITPVFRQSRIFYPWINHHFRFQGNAYPQHSQASEPYSFHKILFALYINSTNEDGKIRKESAIFMQKKLKREIRQGKWPDSCLPKHAGRRSHAARSPQNGQAMRQ